MTVKEESVIGDPDRHLRVALSLILALYGVMRLSSFIGLCFHLYDTPIGQGHQLVSSSRHGLSSLKIPTEDSERVSNIAFT